MAADAGRVCDVVVCVDMTLAALQTESARQWPAGGCVIERRRIPVRRCMANLALLREASRRVIGVVRVLEVFQMAADAGRAAQVVVHSLMALRTCDADMRAGDRKCRF